MEILPKQLGLEGASTVKTPGDKNDLNKTFRFRDLDGEDGGQDGDTAFYVDELFTKKRHGVSPGRVPASPLMRKADPKLTRARWADTDSEEDEHKPSMDYPLAARVADVRISVLRVGWNAQTVFGERVLSELSGCPDVRSDASLIQWCETV